MFQEKWMLTDVMSEKCWWVGFLRALMAARTAAMHTASTARTGAAPQYTEIQPSSGRRRERAVGHSPGLGGAITGDSATPIRPTHSPVTLSNLVPCPHLSEVKRSLTQRRSKTLS